MSEVLRLKCEHFFCKDCTVAYLDNLISTRQVTNLKCPQYKCEETLKYDHFSHFLSAEQREKYARFKEDLAIAKDSSKLYCPNESCSKILDIPVLKRKRAKE